MGNEYPARGPWFRMISKMSGSQKQRAFFRHVNRGDRYKAERDWPNAAAHYSKALSVQPLSASSWAQYGYVLQQQSHLGQSEAAYRIALALDHGVADTHQRLGHILALQGREEEARKAYSTAVGLGASCDNATHEFQMRQKQTEQTINFPVELAEKRSYSTEAEDLLVDRVFQWILGPDYVGSYLDIGANHPVFHSNTFFFYLRGWSGIAVEPNPDLCEEFRKIRPRDKVLNVAVAGQSSVVKYHRFADSFLNSISPEWGEYRIKGGEEYLGSCEIHCISPQDLLKHVETPIDFMNIDIEGVDAEVLSRWDWSACKPTVICAEILSLEIRDMLETDVAQILLAAGYRPASRGWQSAIFIADEAIRVYLEKITNPV